MKTVWRDVLSSALFRRDGSTGRNRSVAISIRLGFEKLQEWSTPILNISLHYAAPGVTEGRSRVSISHSFLREPWSAGTVKSGMTSLKRCARRCGKEVVHKRETTCRNKARS